MAFARQAPDEPSIYSGVGRESCLAFMPADGGTITREMCPAQYITYADTMVDTWYEPALSPDGKLLAFMWQRGFRVSALGYFDTYLMVTAPDRPGDTTQTRVYVNYTEPVGNPFPRRAEIATHLTWAGPGTLLFLATYEHIQKVKGGGAVRVTDTTYEPLALMSMDVRTGAYHVVPGGSYVGAYAVAPSGQLWVAGGSGVLLLDTLTGATAPVAAVPGGVAELINVGGTLVVLRQDARTIVTVDTATGVSTPVAGFATPVHRISAAGGRRVVVEVEQGNALFGTPTDLWLIELP
jgi:hypothetical protein